MGGPIGVMSPKFLLKAGMLLVSARLDSHAVTATIDPSSPVTIVDPDVVRRIDRVPTEPGPAQMRKVHLIGMDHAEISIRNVSVGVVPAGAGMAIGSDALSDMVIGFDFARSRLRIRDRSEQARAGHGLTAVPLDWGAGKCLTMPGVDAQGAAVKVALLPGASAQSPSSERREVTLGSAKVEAWAPAPATCPGSDVSMDWSGFGKTWVELDMAHHRLWLAATVPTI